MATETKPNLEVVYENNKRVSDNADKFVEAHFDKSVTHKMYGDILNVVSDDGAGRKSISTFTATRIDQASKPTTASGSSTAKK